MFLMGVTIIFNLSKNDMALFFESMKFLFSIIAAYVGIKAVVNSSKSAALSAESIKLTKEKELREQSSHLIVGSLIDKFPFNAPLYKETFLYDLPDESEGITFRRKAFPREFSSQVKEFIAETRADFATTILDKRYIPNVNQHVINIMNNGKGSCVNVQYEFLFKNISEFVSYEIPYPEAAISVTSTYPTYQLKISEMKKFYEIHIIDNHILDYLDSTTIEKPFVGVYSGRSYNYLKREENIEYINHIKPSETKEVFIPNEFMILCKHYAIQYYLQKNDSLFSLVRNRVKPLIDNRLIKPVGKIIISFYDESLIRTGEYSPEQRTVLEYNVELKNEAIKKTNDNQTHFYLEVNLSKSENTIRNH